MFILLCCLTLINAQLHMTNHGGSGGADTGRPYRWVGEGVTNAPKAPAHPPRLDGLPYEPPMISSVSTDSLEAMRKGGERLEAQYERVTDAYARFSGSEAIIDEANNALRTSANYFLEERFEEANIAGDIADGLLDLATSLTPGISWGRDLYEAITGKDLHSGEVLGNFSRTMAILGSITFGFGSKAGKAIGVFEKLVKKADELGIARKLLHEKPISELKVTVSFFKKYKIYDGIHDKEAVSVTNAFLKEAKLSVLPGNLKVIRYSPIGDPVRGAWVTLKELADPHTELALLHSRPMTKTEFWILKGTEVLRGKAAPQTALDTGILRKGGAEQILVDPNFLMEILP